MNHQQTNLYDILDQLENRKAMFLGNSYTFESFGTFVTGFVIASDNSQLETEQFNNFGYFSTWLLGHLPEHYGRSAGWNWQISNHHLNDEKNAFQAFFKFLKIFKSAHKTVVSIGTFKKTTFDHSKAIWIEGKMHGRTINQWCLSEQEYNTIVKDLKDGTK